LIRNLLPSVH